MKKKTSAMLLLMLLLNLAATAQTAYKINIYKSKYLLEVLQNNVKIYAFNVVFGNPIGDKFKEGDRKTPIGTFKIKAKYPHKGWKYFLWIDYPTKESWTRFNTRKANGQLKKNDRIGGSIGIHGVPPNCDYLIAERSNWTLGCISLSRKNIEILYQLIPVGTEVQIFE